MSFETQVIKVAFTNKQIGILRKFDKLRRPFCISRIAYDSGSNFNSQAMGKSCFRMNDGHGNQTDIVDDRQFFILEIFKQKGQFPQYITTRIKKRQELFEPLFESWRTNNRQWFL